MFRNAASEFVYVRTYSRWIDELSRRETWPGTVKRYTDFIKKHLGDKIPAKVISNIESRLLSFDVMPSMRFLWAAGGPAEADNTTIYNCSFACIDRPESFSEALYILMCGTGYGFSVENKYISKLPVIPKEIALTDGVYVIEDSRKGWADSVKELISNLYVGQDMTFDYNKIRPAGARLKTMGGRSSGPAPLAQLHSFVKDVFHNARGRKLTSLECHDILNEIAQIVVVGGVRRSSEISISDLDDELMRNSKLGSFPVRRYMANNSAVYTSKPDMVTFLKEWTSLIASGSGERGIFNLEAAKKMAPKRRNRDLLAGTNPCVVGETEVLTRDGYARIDSLVGQELEIWNGFEWSSVTPKVTGENQPIVTVTLSNGTSLTCTDYHRFETAVGYTGTSKPVIAKDLEPGMKLIKHEFPIIEHGPELKNAYTNGFVSAEGTELGTILYVYKPKEMCLDRLENIKSKNWEPNSNRYRVTMSETPTSKKLVPIQYNLKSKLDWLAGLFDGDGTELKEGGLQLVSVDKKFLKDVQKLLTTVGVQCKILPGHEGGFKAMPNHKGSYSDYYCQESNRICVGAVQMQSLKKLGLKCERMSFDKNPQRDASQFVTVVDVTESGVADLVYCFNEPKRHLAVFNGVVTGQCAEIQLRSEEFCNLSEVVAREDDDIDSMLQKIETAVWAGVIQACFTDFPYLSENWKKNCDEERLLGVSITGQFDAPHVCTPEALKAYKAKAIRVAKKASEIMGIPMPAAITCVKPSGTVSQLVDSSSGLHPRFAKYYIRRYRISGNDPLFKMIRDQGLPVSPENGQRKQDYVKAVRIFDATEDKVEGMRLAKSICPIFDSKGWTSDKVNTWVVSFPAQSPETAITVEDISAIDQLEWYKKVQTNWCEHNASITVYVRPEEWLLVGNWVYKNWDIVNGVSFLPYSEHIYEQAPYEKITKEEYDTMASKFPVIDYSKLSSYEQEDNTEGAKSLACVSGSCEM